jgi:hypothetical protein
MKSCYFVFITLYVSVRICTQSSQFTENILSSRPGGLNSALLDCLLGYSGISYNSSARTPQKTCDTCQTGLLPALVMARTTQKTQPHLLLRVGTCLRSRCLATRWSSPLQYHNTVKPREYSRMLCCLYGCEILSLGENVDCRLLEWNGRGNLWSKMRYGTNGWRKLHSQVLYILCFLSNITSIYIKEDATRLGM